MYKQGQRWFSEAEPELGLGLIVESIDKTVKVNFPAADQIRTYGIKSAPLKRVQYEAGEVIITEEDQSFEVKEVQDNDGVLFYLTQESAIPEMLLKSALSFTKPQDKLFAGNFDSNELFKLRYQSYLHQRAYQQFEHKGLLGSRLRLIPHQSYITHSVTKRLSPRVMLADEVGLGKTIEAGLIIKSMIQKNQVERVLIIVPDSLVYQWYFELLNKFNLQCKVMSVNDELDIEALSIDEGQHYIISLKKIMEDDNLAQDVIEQKWDMLVVDEAHQLRWTKENASQEYLFVKELSKQTPSVVLLSATPEILGREGHFSRLNLLDPNKFPNLDKFEEDSQKYQEYIPLIKNIIYDDYSDTDLEKYFSSDEIKSFSSHQEIINALIDRHGTGRIYFRNTREHLEKFKLFFPKRKLHDYPLNIDGQVNDKTVFKAKMNELFKLLNNSDNDKILLLVHSKVLVQKISIALKKETSLPIAMFHSGQSLMERDRQAAYFADNEGARILLCTEIGSEGRNFEFAHHLFLFDLPKVPEQLEQRIGRLDRIGQTKDINIHIPYVCSSFEEVLFKWYRDVLKSFNQAPKGASSFYKEHFASLHELLESPYDSQMLESFINEKASMYDQLCRKLSEGHDLLLDLNSFNNDIAQSVIKDIQNYNQDLRSYIELISNAVGLHFEDLNEFSYFIKPSENMYLPSYPALPNDGYSFTLDRDKALIRDDLQYMSWEHPLVQGSLDLFTNSEIGNMTVATHSEKLGQNIFFEFIFKLEIIHGLKSGAVQYLPITPVRVLLDASASDVTQKIPKSKLDPILTDIQSAGDREKVKQIPKDAFKQLLAKAQSLAKQRAPKYINKALEECNHNCDLEIFRLKELASVNPNVDQKEIQQWQEHKDKLIEQIKDADLSIDAIRVII